MKITNGKAFIDGSFTSVDVHIEKGLFSDSSSDDITIDAAGGYIIPGLIDLHFHGCKGSDFCDGTQAAFETLADYEASRGVTAICPATMTYPEAKLAEIMDAAAAFSPTDTQAALVGINMEGPFISPNKVGAQNPAYVQRCDIEMFERLAQRSGNLVKLIDVAPEEPGALEFIEAVSSDVTVSLAHTTATYDQARKAIDAGARQITHLFNAMPPLHHREPGPIAAAAEHPDVMVEVIADGVHINPAMVRLAFALFGADRVILISDSMMATGMDDGDYSLGGQAVTVQGNLATLKDGTIAGSATDLARCVQIAVNDMGIPIEDAIKAATENPARSIGIDATRGSIASGKIADCVILDENLNVATVIVRGTVIR